MHNSHISDPKKVIRKVALLDKELKIAEKFDNLTSAAKHYGIEDGQISQVAKGKNKSVKWKNENNEIERLRFAFIKDDGTLDLKDKHRALLEHSGDCYYRVFNSGNFQLNDYPSTAAVARATGVPAKKIKMHFNTTNEPFKIQYFEIQRISIS